MVQALLDAIAALSAQLADVSSQVQLAHDQGVQEGKDSRNDEVAALQARIAELEGQQPGGFSQADVDAAVASAVAALKVQLLAAYDSQQLSESESEAQVRALLS